jgi:dTDP-4-dehydrorhamnose reductase
VPSPAILYDAPMPICPPLPSAIPLPLLITGITGVAGYNAFMYFRRRYPAQVVGVRPPQTWQLAGADIVPLDIEDRAGLQALFAAHRFGSVLTAAGNCALKSCELDTAMARRINVASAANIADLSRRHDCRLVHLSSDLVFSGAGAGAGGYVEAHPVDPVTVYGRMMAEGELTIRAADPGAGVLRISLPMGPSFSQRAGAIDWIESRFRNGRPATLYFDEVRSCTYTDDLNRVFEYFLATGLDGLFHVGGPRAMTLYQIGQIVNRVGGFDPALLRGCPRHAAGPMPPRAGDVSMNSDKLLSILGGNPFAPWPVGDDLLPTHRNWHWLRPHERPDSRQQLVARLYEYVGSKALAG